MLSYREYIRSVRESQASESDEDAGEGILQTVIDTKREERKKELDAVKGRHVRNRVKNDIRKALKSLHGGLRDKKAVSQREFAKRDVVRRVTPAGVLEASAPRLVGYEWRTTDGVRYSAREEGMVDGKVSDWSRSETSEISKKKIVHIYWIEGEDGKVKPYGKHSALKALGLWYERELERKIKPFVDKIQHDQIAIRSQFAEWKSNIEYMKKSGRPDCSSEDPRDKFNYHLTKLSAKPSRVWRFAAHVAQRESVKVSEACVFFKLDGYWACFSVGEGKNDVSRANVLAYLEANKIKEIPFREFMAAVKKDTYD